MPAFAIIAGGIIGLTLARDLAPRRSDVTVFGLRTLEAMHASGVSAAVLEAGKVIVLDKPAVLKQAKAWGITLHGF